MGTWPHTLPLSLLPVVPGAGSSVEVGGVFDVAIAGRGYMIDWAANEAAYRHDTTPLLRPQSDTGSTIGEQSINPEGPWRRTFDSFHKGAGQRFRDQAESDPARFLESNGVDVWTEGQLSLLPDTEMALASASTNLELAVAGSRLYVGDGQTLKFSSNPFAASPTWTTVTGTPASAITGITSDGFQVYVGYGVNGIYETDASKSTAAQWLTTNSTDVAYVRGRIMVSSGNILYNPTKAVASSGSGGSAIFTHRSPSFAFVGFAETLNQIYAAGFQGDKSEIYRITLKEDGTGLDAPIVAGVLPDGEVANDIYGYLGFILIGTTKGIRFAVPDAQGNLTIGALIDTGAPIRNFEGQGRFVWFTWERLNETQSGLGRIDLTSFFDADALVPAYTKDLTVTSQANVTSVATYENKTVFSIAGEGIYYESDDLVESGTISPGVITYGLSERKTSRDVLVVADLAAGSSVQIKLSVDGGPTESLGTITSSGTLKVLTNEVAGHRFEPALTLHRSTTDATTGPTVYSGTLRAFPRVEATKYILVTVLLRPSVRTRSGTQVFYNAEVDRAALDALWRTQQITTFQEGNQSWPVLVSDYSFQGEDEPDNSEDLYGSLQLRLKVVT